MFHTRCCWGWIKDAFCFRPVNWVNKAASVCIWEIQTWRKGGRIWVLDLETYQGSAGSEAPFIPMYGCEAHVFPLVSISVHSLCRAWWNLWYCWLHVHWRTLTLFSHILLGPPFCHLCLSSLNRSAIRREGDSGESRCRPEPHDGGGSHCCGHS